MDKALLRYYISKANLSTAELAEKLKVSLKTVQNKLSGKTEFTASEIRRLAEVCNLEGNDIVQIFFSQNVA